jgi:hypothetical protein
LLPLGDGTSVGDVERRVDWFGSQHQSARSFSLLVRIDVYLREEEVGLAEAQVRDLHDGAFCEFLTGHNGRSGFGQTRLPSFALIAFRPDWTCGTLLSGRTVSSRVALRPHLTLWTLGAGCTCLALWTLRADFTLRTLSTISSGVTFRALGTNFALWSGGTCIALRADGTYVALWPLWTCFARCPVGSRCACRSCGSRQALCTGLPSRPSRTHLTLRTNGTLRSGWTLGACGTRRSSRAYWPLNRREGHLTAEV